LLEELTGGDYGEDRFTITASVVVRLFNEGALGPAVTKRASGEEITLFSGKGAKSESHGK
jgi:hypothetical protein